MTSLEFGEIVKQICHYLTYLSESNPKLIAACRTGEDFEQCVFDAAETTLATLGISATVFYTQGIKCDATKQKVPTSGSPAMASTVV